MDLRCPGELWNPIEGVWLTNGWLLAAAQLCLRQVPVLAIESVDSTAVDIPVVRPLLDFRLGRFGNRGWGLCALFHHPFGLELCHPLPSFLAAWCPAVGANENRALSFEIAYRGNANAGSSSFGTSSSSTPGGLQYSRTRTGRR